MFQPNVLDNLPSCKRCGGRRSGASGRRKVEDLWDLREQPPSSGNRDYHNWDKRSADRASAHSRYINMNSTHNLPLTIATERRLKSRKERRKKNRTLLAYAARFTKTSLSLMIFKCYVYTLQQRTVIYCITYITIHWPGASLLKQRLLAAWLPQLSGPGARFNGGPNCGNIANAIASAILPCLVFVHPYIFCMYHFNQNRRMHSVSGSVFCIP